MQQTAALRAAGRPVPALRPVYTYVSWTLLLAGLSELLLFRTLSRVGVHIPKEGLALRVYDGLVQVGSYAFNVSSVAVVVALALLAHAAYRGEFGRRPLLAAVSPALAAFAGISLLLAFVAEGPSVKFWYGLLSLAMMLALAAQAWSDRRRERLRALVVGLTVLAYLAAQYNVLAILAYQALGLTAEPPATMRVLEVAEALVLANAFVMFWGWSGLQAGLRFRRRRTSIWPGRPSFLQVAAGGLLVAIFLGSYYGQPDSSTAAILSLWSLGLTLYLPLPLYAVALWLYGAALVGCLQRSWRGEAPPWDAVALGLLPVAGLTLELTYQHLVAVVALLLLIAGAGESADPARNQRMPVRLPG